MAAMNISHGCSVEPKREASDSPAPDTEESEMKFDIAKVKVEPVDTELDGMHTAAFLGETVYPNGNNDLEEKTIVPAQLVKQEGPGDIDIKVEPADVEIDDLNSDLVLEETDYSAIAIEKITVGPKLHSQPGKGEDGLVDHFSSATHKGHDSSSSKKKPDSKAKRTEETIHDCSCLECGKNFKFKSDLARHMSFHVEKRSYVCKICHKGFTLKTNMNFHMWTHATEKLFKCDKCGVSFSQEAELRAHLPTHNKQRSEHVTQYKIKNCKRVYECNECEKTFAQRPSLRLHKLIHTLNQEKPFKCRVCEEPFACFYQLKEHQKTHESVTGPQKCDSGIQTDHIEATEGVVIESCQHQDEVPKEMLITSDLHQDHKSAQLVVPKVRSALSSDDQIDSYKEWDLQVKKIKLEPEVGVSSIGAGTSIQSASPVGPGVGKLVLPKIGNILLKLAKAWPGEQL